MKKEGWSFHWYIGVNAFILLIKFYLYQILIIITIVIIIAVITIVITVVIILAIIIITIIIVETAVREDRTPGGKQKVKRPKVEDSEVQILEDCINQLIQAQPDVMPYLTGALDVMGFEIATLFNYKSFDGDSCQNYLH